MTMKAIVQRKNTIKSGRGERLMKHERRVNRKWVSYRIIALFLAVLILVNMVPDYLLTVSAESANDSGFELALSWNKNDQNEGKNTYLYDSASRETKMVRLKLSYKNNNVTNGYEPGELIVTVPGLKDAAFFCLVWYIKSERRRLASTLMKRNTKTPHDHQGKQLNPYSSFLTDFIIPQAQSLVHRTG